MIPFLVCAVLISSASLRQGSAPQTTAQTPASLRVDWHTEKKLWLSGNKPVYPRIAMMAQIEGVVRIRTIVAADGSTKELEYLSGPPLLMLAALNVVRTWRFKPPLVNGESAEIHNWEPSLLWLCPGR